MLSIIKAKIINGEKLANAIKSKKSFTAYEYHSINIGEESGRLVAILQELSPYFQRKIKLKRQFTGTLIYPAIVLMAAIDALVFMLVFVVPMFSEVFKRFKGDLPFITRTIIKISAGFKSYSIVGLIIIAALAIYISVNRNKSWFRHLSSTLLTKIPILELVKKIYLASDWIVFEAI